MTGNERRDLIRKIVRLLEETRSSEEWLCLVAMRSANKTLDEAGLSWDDLLQAQLDEPTKFDFERIYERYPRKIGKKTGIDRLKRKIRTADKYASLELAVENYRLYHERKQSERCYILHFSTFVNQWENYIDPAFIEEELGPEKPKLTEADTTPEGWDDYT
jgi:hypothetical protein